MHLIIFFVWSDICCNDIDIHVLYCVIVKYDHWTAIKLIYSRIFGMDGVWHEATLPDLNGKAAGSDI